MDLIILEWPCAIKLKIIIGCMLVFKLASIQHALN